MLIHMNLRSIIYYKILIMAGLWAAECPGTRAGCRQDPDSLLEVLTLCSAQEIRAPAGDVQTLNGDWSSLRDLQQSRLQLNKLLLEGYVQLAPQGPLRSEALEDLRYLQSSCSRALSWNGSHLPHPAGYPLQLDWQLEALSAHIGALPGGLSLPGRGTLQDSWTLLEAWLGELRQSRQYWGRWLQRYVSATRPTPLSAL